MKLDKLGISNFRSIVELEINLPIIDRSATYALLGINESGKSSILQGLALLDDEEIDYPLDYFDKSKGVEINAYYDLDEKDQKKMISEITSNFKLPKPLISQIRAKSVMIGCYYSPNSESKLDLYESIDFEKETFEDYYEDNGEIFKRDDNKEAKALNLNNFFSAHLENYFYNLSHRVVIWKSSPEYLVLNDIDLTEFVTTPERTSIPLLNCFKLAGFVKKDLAKVISSLSSSVEIANLESKLSAVVTEHINNVWPEHPISILFKINNNQLSLLIEDNGIKYSAKTIRQRSDGFKQFISFLLTLSVENHNQELANTILLIDEPETHLHPPAQLNLLKELISITQNNKNNIVLFATHSNYLIDKVNLERNIKVEKVKNERTELKYIEQKKSSYAEVNFEVFGIQTSDYHNELYGFIESNDESRLKSLSKDRKWYNEKTNEESPVSQAEYIRHWIHHPENDRNKPVSDFALKKSIKALRKIKAEILKK